MSDVKKMVGEIREALDAYPREALAEMLTHVFKEYVVQGTGALPSPILNARSELEGMSFAELIQWLQAHLDVPELALFEVQGGRVSVRGVTIEARTPAPAPTPAPVPTPAPAPVAAPAPAPTAPAAETKKDEPATPAGDSRFSLLEVDD